MHEMLVGVLLAERYRLLRCHAHDERGWTFIAQDEPRAAEVVVALLRPSLCRVPERVGPMRKEARVVAQLGCRHIAGATDFGATETGTVFIVRDGPEGEDLRSTLERDGPLPSSRVVPILRQLSTALRVAHDAGVVHGQLRPTSVRRTETKQDPDFVQIVDFGLARLVPPAELSKTLHDHVPEHPEFIAPEQVMGDAVDPRVDVYSLSACAYLLLTGRPPFSGDSWFEVTRRLLSEDPEPPSEAGAPAASVPPWLDAIIVRCLRRKPEQRYGSMRELADALAGAPGR